MKLRKLVANIVLPLILGAAALLAMPAGAQAADEQYRWKDQARQAIIATEGEFELETEFANPTRSADSLTFTAPGVTYDCGGRYTPNLKIIVKTGDYDLSVPDTAARLVFDPPPGRCIFKPDENITIRQDQAATTAAAQERQCDEGAMSWVMCPILTKLEEAITSVAATILEPVLKVAPLRASQDSGLYKTWSAMRNIANIGFVIIFFVLIFANTLSLNLDYYTIKRVLPRLILAAILVQFSFLLSGLIVDIGNVLGSGVNVLFESINTGSAPRDGGNIIENLGLTLAVTGILFKVAWPMVLPILAILALTVLTFYLVMSIRLILIAILVVLSPLAMVAWTLPNTEKYFKNWANYLIRLTLMYPMIMAILSGAGMVNELLAFTGSTANNGLAGLAVDLMRPLIFIGAFLLIPATFLWSGKLMTAVGAAGVVAAVSGYRGSLKDRQFYKDAINRRTTKQVEAMDSLERRTRFMTKGQTRASQVFGRGTRAVVRTGGGWYFGGAPATPLAKARAFTSVFTTYDKELETLPDTQVPYLKDALTVAYSPDSSKRSASRTSLQASAPALMKYTDSFAGRAALVKRLDNFKMVRMNDLDNILATKPEEFGMALRVSSNLQKNIPVVAMRYGLHELNDAGIEMPVGALKTDVLKSIIGGLQPGGLREDFHQENFDIAAREADAAQVIAENASSITFAKVFDADAQTFADANKRKAIIKMIAKQHQFFQAGKGKDLRDAIVNMMSQQSKNLGKAKGSDILEDTLKEHFGMTDAQLGVMLEQDKLDILKRFL